MATQTAQDRFWGHVSQEEDCWVWQGARTDQGYGNFAVEGRYVGAHRFAFESLCADIPEGLVLDHLCRNRACVNPAHLEPVTHRVNVLRGFGRSSGRSAPTKECKYGHEFSPENTYTWRGQRKCRNCHARRARLKRKGERSMTTDNTQVTPVGEVVVR